MSDEQTSPEHGQASIDAGLEFDAFDNEQISDDQLSETSTEEAIGQQAQSKNGIDNTDYKQEQIYARGFIMDNATIGDVAGSTIIKNYFNGAPPRTNEVAVDPVPEHEIRHVEAVYVRAANYDRAQHLLDKQRVLILWGDAALGKATTALHLLIARKRPIMRIDPEVDSDQLKNFAFTSNYAFLIDSLAAERALTISDFLLGKLSRQMQQTQSYLIITVNNQPPHSQPELRDYLLRWSERPIYIDMLKQHLISKIPAEDAEARTLAEKISADPRIIEALSQTHPLYAIAELATLLKQVINGQCTRDAALEQFSALLQEGNSSAQPPVKPSRIAQHMTLDPNEIDAWFKAPERTLADRSLMITLAVFSGAQQQSVREAEQALVELLDPPQADAKPISPKPGTDATEATSPEPEAEAAKVNPPQPDVFISWRDRLRTIGASTKVSRQKTNIGMAELPIIQFGDRRLQAAVLDYVWYEYDRLQVQLIKWLQQMGRHSTPDVRGFAAAATGYLARLDLATIVNAVITPWALDPRWQIRQSAAQALGVLSYDDRFRKNVEKLLAGWSKPSANIKLKLTAASAYGGLFGGRYPDIALPQLYVMIHTQVVDRRLLYQVINSTMTLFQHQHENPEHALKVLEALVIWTEEPGLRFSIWAGLVTFLRMTRSRVPATPGDGRWPTLLWLCQEHKECRKRIITLWRRALANPLTENPALNSELRRWLRATVQDERLYPAFEKLLRALMRGEQDNRARIEYWLENQIVAEPKHAVTAQKLLIMLTPEACDAKRRPDEQS